MSLDPTLATKIIAAVDAGFDEQIEFTRDLIRHPSLRGREHTAQEMVHNAFRERGYPTDRWAIDVDEIKHHPGFSPVEVSYENAINVVATHTPKQATGRSLILNGHIDVVPEGPLNMWTHPPFDPHVEGDWLYGRGGGDMKAGLAANIFALDALRRMGMQPAGTVYLQSVTEEECTGNGALAALIRGYSADAAIIPEPSEHTLVRGNTGSLWFRIKVTGHPVHAREATAGANAIEAAYRILAELRVLEAEMNSDEEKHPRFARHAHPLNLNLGKIAGGDWASSVPAWCEMDMRLAFYPDQQPEDVARRIEAAVSRACRDDPYLSNNPAEIEWNGFFSRGYILDEGSDAEGVLINAHRRAQDAELISEMATGYLDGRVFMLYDDCPCLVYGPRTENIHGFDERVSLASIQQITHTIALFVAEWCGLEEI